MAPRGAERRSRRAPGAVALLAAALGAAAATGLWLPRQSFTATAIVGVEGGPAALRPALVQAAADAALSRPVVGRAAGILARTRQGDARSLAGTIEARSGIVPGALLVRAADTDAEAASATATAVASALVGDLGDRALEAGRQSSVADAPRLAALQEAAAAAHRRLAALGGAPDDPAGARSDESGRLDSLRGRLDAIRAILAAGDPPLGAGHDVPPGIDALQTTYLDLARQLAKARATLGDRHTTVLGLQDSLRRTAADLTVSWKRLETVTETELAEATSRAGAQDGDDAASRAAAIDAARLAAQAADEAVTRAAAPQDEDLPRWRLIAPASVPAFADGLPLPLRLALASAVGLVLLLSGLGWRRRRAGAPIDASVAASRAVEDALAPGRAPVFFDDVEAHAARVEPILATPSVEPVEQVEDDIALRDATPDDLETDEADLEEAILDDEAAHDAVERATADSPGARHASARRSAAARNRDLVAAAALVLPAIRTTARLGVPVVLVAANEIGLETLDVVVALGEAAAGAGRRVLLVERDRGQPALAAAADVEAEPALIDAFGEMRVVLRAEGGGGLIYLAPSFGDGGRLAANLARTGDTLVADALADEFDLVVLDGGRAADAVRLARDASSVLRVGRFASARDDERFVSILNSSRAAFLGTIAADAFVPPADVPKAPAPNAPAGATARPTMPASSAALAAGRRPVSIHGRRRVGLR